VPIITHRDLSDGLTIVDGNHRFDCAIRIGKKKLMADEARKEMRQKAKQQALIDVDGDLTSSISISGSVDTSTAGTYSIVYSVADAAGNQNKL